MKGRRITPADPSIRVGIEMPASVYMRLRAHADATGTSISRLCRDGALRAIETVAAAEGEP